MIQNIQNLILITACSLLLAACAGGPYAAVNASNHGVSGSIGQTFQC